MWSLHTLLVTFLEIAMHLASHLTPLPVGQQASEARDIEAGESAGREAAGQPSVRRHSLVQRQLGSRLGERGTAHKGR
ncbi:hypothetical protein KFL_006890020 [Klebsormidium nitens]|uniref:Secreted protein n=1 Tax=Klebsormidium nitens TaxID=105231 RepID=A0A1Y1IQB5_KLENI|nr:hypothetical protein KFL_006890020 [Klebsormidium nitens]|eukprot:GAQ90817.1 hypothetical protein KFL_006890020 [Klebsormidium nitens]